MGILRSKNEIPLFSLCVVDCVVSCKKVQKVLSHRFLGKNPSEKVRSKMLFFQWTWDFLEKQSFETHFFGVYFNETFLWIRIKQHFGNLCTLLDFFCEKKKICSEKGLLVIFENTKSEKRLKETKHMKYFGFRFPIPIKNAWTICSFKNHCSLLCTR